MKKGEESRQRLIECAAVMGMETAFSKLNVVAVFMNGLKKFELDYSPLSERTISNFFKKVLEDDVRSSSILKLSIKDFCTEILLT